MKQRSLLIFLIGALLLPLGAYSQTGGKPPAGKKAIPLPDADSLKGLMRALDRKDTTALKKYGVMPGSLTRPDKPRSAHLAMMARADRDSIVLRWAPSKPGAWIETNRYGYMLERVTMVKGKILAGSLKKLTAAPLKPWTLDEWKQRAPRDDRFAAIAAQTLYGKTFKQTADMTSGMAMRAGVDELEGRYGFALFSADNDPLVANGLALRYVDRDVKQGEQYVYRLHLAVKDTSYHLDTAYATASSATPEVPPAPPNLTAEGFDRHINLQWGDFPSGLAYSGFNVYRSGDGGKSYRKLNDNPVVTPYREGAREKTMPSYTDTTIVNYHKYRYQIRGITPFAEESKAAEVEAEGTNRTPPPRPVIGKPEQIARHSVRIPWQMPDTAKGIAGFVVSRSADNMQGYVPITVTIHLPPGKAGQQPTVSPDAETREIMRQLISPSVRSYVDSNATSAEPYYMVGAVDTSGNLSQSLPAYAAIIDSLPPRVPTGFAGKIDTNGIVHLHWNLGPEPNVIGYRVVWANDPRHEFTQRTPRVVKDTVFTDTINIHTLTRYIYYRVAAVNDRFIHSALSPILALHRPDVVPPGAPQFTNVLVSDTSVALFWATSSSDDVKLQRLYRKKGADTSWGLLASLAPAQSSYNDRAVAKRVMYQYSLEAVDSSGLRSKPSAPVQGRPYDTGERPGVTGFNGKVNEKGTAVHLSWTYATPPKERYWFILYRAYGADGLMQYHSIGGTAKAFDDKDLVGKGTYKYAIRVATDSGGLSPISAPLVVQVK